MTYGDNGYDLRHSCNHSDFSPSSTIIFLQGDHWQGFDKAEYLPILADTMHDRHLDAWAHVLEHAYSIDEDGYKWTLSQDCDPETGYLQEDLWILCPDRMPDDHYLSFYGEPRASASPTPR